MKRHIIFLLLLVSISTCKSQHEINANVKIDAFGNLHIDEFLTTLCDTLIINSKILLHKNDANLIGSVKLEKIKYIEYVPKIKNISYVVNLPKGKSNTYLKGKDFFITTIEYLAFAKSDLPKKKKFKINIELPENYKLIYPDLEDLENKFYHVPPIVAGLFNERKNNGFNIFTLNKYKGGF